MSVARRVVDANDAHYVHNQTVASATWTVRHFLGKNPAVDVVDSAGSVCYGAIQHTDTNTTVLRFSSAFSGIAYCN
jgi:hypothetical protein